MSAPTYDRAVFLEDAHWLADTGESWLGAAHRLHLTPEAMEKRLRRLGRLDLARRTRGYVQWTCDRQRQTRETA